MAKKRVIKNNRVNFLKKTYVPLIEKDGSWELEVGQRFEDIEIKSPEDVFDAICKSDPSSNKKYLNWMLERYVKDAPEKNNPETSGALTPKRLLVEDLDKTANFLEFFQKHNDKFLEENRNISDYMCVDDFFDAVEEIMPKDGEVISATQLSQKFKKETDVWVDNENWKVLVPLTYEASCAYGKNTRWCTASKTNRYQFDHHDKKGPLIIIINKKAAKDDFKTHKFQFHFETDQFMDAKDNSIKESYLSLIGSDEEMKEAFLKNVDNKFTFLMRMKLGVEIPKEELLLKNEDGSPYNLNLKDMASDSLPDGIEIYGNVYINDNEYIKKIQNITVHGNLELKNSSIEVIGKGVRVKGMLSANDSDLTTIEDGLHISENGVLYINNCVNLKALPDNSYVGGSIFASGCEKIDSIPLNLRTKYAVYLKKTKFARDLIDGVKKFPENIDKIGTGGREIIYTGFKKKV